MDNIVKAYVDGSFNEKTYEYSYGVVFLINNEEYKMSGNGKNKEMIIMRNVAGELMASIFAIKWCIDNKIMMSIKTLAIYYDYEGIKKLATGEWKATKKWTIEYKNVYDKAKDIIQIHFIKVKSHTGNKYNDMADKLAKQI